MEKKITIECGFEEVCLIERALELYSRVGILQFEYLTICTSLQKLVWGKEVDFDTQARLLKIPLGYEPNSNPGIFNTKDVHDDVRIAADLYQQIRHERFNDRVRSGEQKILTHSVDEHPADICKIADIDLPNFKVEIK